MRKSLGQSCLVTGASGRLICVDRSSEFLDGVGGHVADAGIGMLKELGELWRGGVVQASLDPFCSGGFGRDVVQQRNVFEDGVSGNLVEGVGGILADGIIGIGPHVEQWGDGWFGVFAEVANGSCSVFANVSSRVAEAGNQCGANGVGHADITGDHVSEDGRGIGGIRRVRVVQ